MPTKREREYYAAGYRDGIRAGSQAVGYEESRELLGIKEGRVSPEFFSELRPKKRKLSAWNKYVKANSKKPRFRLRSGSPNLKKLAVAFRKTPAGKKKRR